MTPEQLMALKAAVLAETDAAFVSARESGNNTSMAQFYSTSAAPTFYVWRKVLSRHEILTGTSDDNTTFAWAAGAYITRSQGERDAFREMFNSTGFVDPSLPSIQAAFSDIFSGAGGAGNRTHINAMSRREVNKGERLFATGTGSKASPGTSGYDGKLSSEDIRIALES
jgi:hypothetical protein